MERSEEARLRTRLATAASAVYGRLCVDPAREWPPRLAAALVGIAFAFGVFDLDFIMGRGTFWSYPPNDMETQLTGYRHFIHDSWHWPLLHTNMVHEGWNVIFSDPNPLVAMPAKLWFHLTGHEPIMYGAWMVACYALQGWFGARLARALGERSFFGGLAAGCLVIFADTFIARFYHQVLCGQFVLLWALAIYFELGSTYSVVRGLKAWSLLLVVTVLIHPYFTAMTFPIALASLLRGSRGVLRERATILGGIVVALGVTGVALGHLNGGPRPRASEFGMASLNPVSIVLPLGGHSSFLPSNSIVQEATGLQWDGTFFLGFGVLGLFGILFAFRARRLVGHVRRHVWLVLALGALGVFALSNRIFVSNHLVASYTIPEALWPIQQFRATGRMFWPLGYFLMVSSAVLTLRYLPRVAGVALVGAAAVIHALDVRPLVEVVHHHTSIAWDHTVDWDEWRAAILAHKRIRQVPSYDCMGGLAGTVLGHEAREVQFIAAIESRPTNGIRTSRPSIDCERELREYRTPRPEADTLTFFPRATSTMKDPALCVPAADWIVCSQRVVQDQTLFTKTRVEVPTLAPGQNVDLGEPDGKAISYFASGWTSVEFGRIWSGARDAEMRFRLVPEPLVGDSYELTFQALALLSGTHTTSTLHVLVNGEEVSTHRFDLEHNSPTEDHYAIIPRRLVPDGEVRLVFRVDDPIVPAEHGLPGPPEPLGVALYRFVLD